MTYKQILSKLTAICARKEHCIQDVRIKMEKWNVDTDTQQQVLDYLIKERYLDESRYAQFFINDKTKYNRWGKHKVELALYQKKIPKEVYAPLLNDIEDSTYEEILVPLMRTKAKSVKGTTYYEKKMKMIRFAMQRGFTYEQAERCLKRIKEPE